MNRNYTPDSVYMVCGEQIQDCDVCSNTVFSPVVNGKVHDPLSGKVFCPFGMGESLNQSVYSDQNYLNRTNNLPRTTWGMAPQLEPRPLAKVGLEWRTS
jgi:hypothetical protein